MDSQLPFYGGSGAGSATPSALQLNLELHRAHLQEYAQRVQLGMRSFPAQFPGMGPLGYSTTHLMSPYFHPYLCKDPRTRFVHEEPKPNHSYIGNVHFYLPLLWLHCFSCWKMAIPLACMLKSNLARLTTKFSSIYDFIIYFFDT